MAFGISTWCRSSLLPPKRRPEQGCGHLSAPERLNAHGTDRASAYSRGVGLTRERGRVAMVVGHAALMHTCAPETIHPPSGLQTVDWRCTALRSVLIVLLSSLVLAAEARARGGEWIAAR